MQRMIKQRAASDMEVDTARAERDVALAQIARTKAVIDRKTIRAPFRARIGISDVHPGQYLNEGTLLTTLQGVDDSAYVDFSVAQQVAASLRAGDTVQVFTAATRADRGVDSRDRRARRSGDAQRDRARARFRGANSAPTPGASVRVQVPVGVARLAVVDSGQRGAQRSGRRSRLRLRRG